MQIHLNQRFRVPPALLAGRAVLAVMLLLSLLSGVVPFAAAFAAPTCRLACCIGRPAHSAGSCMGGACDTGLLTRSGTTRPRFKRAAEEPERLCGSAHLGAQAGRIRILPVAKVDAGYRPEEREDSRAGQTSGRGLWQATVSAAVLVKPCNSECGGCASGSTGNRRPRNLATLSYADRPRPPSLGSSALTYSDRIAALCAQCPQLQPRAPPDVLS